MSQPDTGFFDIAGLGRERAGEGAPYLEFLRVPSMSAGLYVLAAGADDAQLPHREDELYYVVKGRARLRAGSQDLPVGPGSIMFVAAAVEHRFYAIEAELSVMVFFAPAETLGQPAERDPGQD